MRRTDGREGEYKKRRILGAFATAALCLAVCAVLFYVLSVPVFISDATMAPTLSAGDTVFVGRYSFYLRSAARGDLAAYEESGRVAVRRVAALAGETVASFEGRLYINGVLLDESTYASGDVPELEEFTVPENCVYLLPDARASLADAGLVCPVTELKGRVLFRTSPISEIALF